VDPRQRPTARRFAPDSARRLLGLIAPHRRRIALSLGLTALVCLLNLPVPLLIQGLVDRVVATGDLRRLPGFAAALLVVFAAQAGVNLVNGRVIGGVGLSVVRDLRHHLYARLQRLSLSYYDKTPTGVIISRLMDDVATVQALITSQTVTILTDLGTTLTVAALLLARDARLAVTVLVFVPVYAVNFRWFTRRIRASSRAVREGLDGVFGHLKQKVDGALVVKAHACESAEVAEFAARLRALHGPRVRADRLGAAFSNVSAAVSGVGTVAVFGVGALEVLEGRMTPGGVVSTAALAALLFGPVARLADLANVFEQAAASLDRLGEILDLRPTVAEPDDPTPIARANGLVEFDRVGFGYKADQPVVWDVRLRAEPGMRVALVGPTGCGKSTLMNLLLRFYDPTWGEVRLDGVPIRRLATADLRRQVGVVLQEPVVFRQSVAENIRYGNPDATAAQVEAAARAAHVHPFALALPDGYDTVVGEGGYKLSQGERQRLSIARAICKDPAVVVLDEATSALDTAGEALVQASLANLLLGRTAFIIAHRLSTVVDADLIVVIDGGLIVQKGTHAQLMADADGLYRRLVTRQFGAPEVLRQRRHADRYLPRPHLFDDAEPLHQRASA
jgi:ABC-type multidrug transport system fused ATPase/permease subunit